MGRQGREMELLREDMRRMKMEKAEDLRTETERATRIQEQMSRMERENTEMKGEAEMSRGYGGRGDMSGGMTWRRVRSGRRRGSPAGHGIGMTGTCPGPPTLAPILGPALCTGSRPRGYPTLTPPGLRQCQSLGPILQLSITSLRHFRLRSILRPPCHQLTRPQPTAMELQMKCTMPTRAPLLKVTTASDKSSLRGLTTMTASRHSPDPRIRWRLWTATRMTTV